jgi:hypothetical protein
VYIEQAQRPKLEINPRKIADFAAQVVPTSQQLHQRCQLLVMCFFCSIPNLVWTAMLRDPTVIVQQCDGNAREMFVTLTTIEELPITGNRCTPSDLCLVNRISMLTILDDISD